MLARQAGRPHHKRGGEHVRCPAGQIRPDSGQYGKTVSEDRSWLVRDFRWISIFVLRPWPKLPILMQTIVCKEYRHLQTAWLGRSGLEPHENGQKQRRKSAADSSLFALGMLGRGSLQTGICLYALVIAPSFRPRGRSKQLPALEKPDLEGEGKVSKLGLCAVAALITTLLGGCCALSCCNRLSGQRFYGPPRLPCRSG